MNPQILPNNQQQQGQQQEVFNQSHHDAFNALRNIGMRFLQMGVPGMGEVVNAITKAHTDQIKKSRLATPGGYNPMQAVGQVANNVVGGIMGNGLPQAGAAQPGVSQYVNPNTAAAQQAIQQGNIPAAFQAFIRNLQQSNTQPTQFGQ